MPKFCRRNSVGSSDPVPDDEPADPNEGFSTDEAGDSGGTDDEDLLLGPC